MNYIDTHFHLDLWNNPESIIEEIEENKIYTIAVTNAPSFYSQTLNATTGKNYIRPALGLHPELVQKRFSELELFLELLASTNYIGEIGLDGNTKYRDNKKKQTLVFEKVLEACSVYKNKILTIHSRAAQKEVIDIIGDKFPSKIILHWYSGSLEELEKAIDYGFYFSINIPMTTSKKGKNIISRIPKNRILTESDGPFTSYDNKKCSPLMMFETVKFISAIIGCEFEVCKKMIHDNFINLLENE